METERAKLDTVRAWKTANFTGAAVHGRLKDLSEYIEETSAAKAPDISFDEFDKKLAEMKAGEKNGTL